MDDQNPMSQILPATQQQAAVASPGANPWNAQPQNQPAQLPQNAQGASAQDAAIQDPQGNSELSQVGSSLDGHCWNGLCESYAEEQTLGHTGVYPSAIAAYNANAQSGNINTGSTNIPKGAQLFFGADSTNGGFGHTTVSLGSDKSGNTLMEGATYNGVKVNTLNSWLQSSGQKYLGWSMPQQSSK